MNDIVDRLAVLAARFTLGAISAAMEEAADEITRLRASVIAARREGIEAAIVACGSVSAETEGVWSHGFTRGIIEAQASIRALLEGER